MPENTETPEVMGNETPENEPYLGTWRDRTAAEEGLKNLTQTLDKQGNELGTLRQQFEKSQQIINDLQTKASAPPPGEPATNYENEMALIQKEMAKLDPVDADYQQNMMNLVMKSNNIAAMAQHEQTLNAATSMFKQELDDRDTQAIYKAFYRDNPDFNTPEMQQRIQDYIAKDTTGMSDPLVAYREIQRDDAAIAAKQLADENAELKRLMDLAKGSDQTGKVISRGQSTQQVTKQPKATGADLDKGMQAALDALR